MVPLISAYNILIATWKEDTFGRSGRRWEGDIEVDPKDIAWDGVKLIYVTYLRAQGSVFWTQ
jgi:hypothetical protein